MGARKRKHVDADDPTLAAMVTEGHEAPAKRRKAAPKERVDPWEAVAAECPCKVSAADHKANRARVHITTVGGPVMCVPGVAIESNRYLPQPMPIRWRTTDAYQFAELSG